MTNIIFPVTLFLFFYYIIFYSTYIFCQHFISKASSVVALTSAERWLRHGKDCLPVSVTTPLINSPALLKYILYLKKKKIIIIIIIIISLFITSNVYNDDIKVNYSHIIEYLIKTRSPFNRSPSLIGLISVIIRCV